MALALLCAIASLIQALVDALTFVVHALVDTVASVIKPTIGPVTPVVHAPVDTVALVIQAIRPLLMTVSRRSV